MMRRGWFFHRSGIYLIRFLFLVLFLPWSLFAKVEPVVFYVSPQGKDSHAGTSVQEPLLTLDRARELVRQIRSKDKSARVVVELLSGTYPLAKSFLLEKSDGGSEGNPVTYRAQERQRACLTGGRVFRLSQLQPVSDPEMKERLPLEARDKVLCLSLSKEKISHGGPFPLKFSDQGGLFEVFDTQGRLPLSRWPNEGYVTMKEVVTIGDAKAPGTFVYRDDRPARWLKNKNVWLKGQWRVGWEDPALKVASIDPTHATITFAVGIPNGIGCKYTRPKGSGKEPWCAINLPEEIDRPGEWAVDFEKEMLLVWPREEGADKELIISQLEQPLLEARDLTDLSLEGLTFQHSLGDAVVLENVERTRVAGCLVQNLGGRGIVLHGVRSGVQSCDVRHIGRGAIFISGGDRRTITRSENYVLNNHLHHYGQLQRQYSAAVHVGVLDNPAFPGKLRDAVGIRVAHNVLHHAPRDAFLYSGNDNLYELNEVYYCGYDTKDTGAWYSWLDWTMRGNVIRHNFVHQTIGGVNPDDGASGNLAYGNVFAGNRTGVWIASGPDNVTRNNIFVKDKGAVFAIDDRGTSRGYATNNKLIARLQEVQPQEEPWKSAHPECATMLENQPDLPWRTRFTGNLIVCKNPVPPMLKIKPQLQTNPAIILIQDNKTIPDDPGFKNPAAFDYSLPADLPLLKEIPGFEPIPFEKIGLQVDEFRPALPTEAERMRGKEFDPYPAGLNDNFGT
jgi:hypothetical protein